MCRSQCDSLRDHASSLTSDLSRLQGLLSRSRRESASFLSACALMAGALKHTQRRLQTLCQQKTLLSRRLAEREVLEEEVRRLAGALGGDEDEEEEDEEEGRRRAERSRAVRRWRRSVCVVLAVRRWRVLAQQTSVLFRVEVGGGGPAVCVCGGATTATQKGQDSVRAGGRSPVCKLLMDVSVSTDELINCLIVFQLKMTMMMMMMMKECALAGCALNLSPPPFCPPCPTCRRRCHTAVTHVSIETAVQLQFCRHDGSLYVSLTLQAPPLQT